MTNIPVRGAVTVILWLSYLGINYVLAEQLGPWVLPLAFVLMIPLVVTMSATWNMFDEDRRASVQKESVTEKFKLEHLDSALRDLSNEELVALKNRLADGTIDDDILYDRLAGDDGEIVNRL